MTTKTIPNFRERIERHFDEVEWDVCFRKKRNAFALYWNEDHEPIAKLRPTGQDDDVEVLQWGGDRWRRITRSGMILGLDEALAYLTDGPLTAPGGAPETRSSKRGLQGASSTVADDVHGLIGGTAFLGAAVGGAFSSLLTAAIVGVLGILLLLAGTHWIRGQWRVSMMLISLFGLPAMLLGLTGSLLGSSVNAALGGGVWGVVLGILVGATSSLFVFNVRALRWLLGMSAGVLIGIQVLGVVPIASQFLRFGLVAVLASCYVKILGTTAAWGLTGSFSTKDAPDDDDS